MATAWKKLVSCCTMFIDMCWRKSHDEVQSLSVAACPYIAIWCVRQPTRWGGWGSTTARRYEWTRSIGLLFVASVVVALLALEPSCPELLAGCSFYRNGGVQTTVLFSLIRSQVFGVSSTKLWCCGCSVLAYSAACSVAIPSTLLPKTVYRQYCSVPYCTSNGELPSPVKTICQLSFAALRSCSRYSVVAARQRYTCFRNIHRFSQCRRRRKGQKTLGAVLPRLPDGLFTPAPTNGK
jgi:hypothetical protein